MFGHAVLALRLTPPSVRLIISFILVFTVGSRISFRTIFLGTSPPHHSLSIPTVIEPYSWTPPTFSFFFFFISEL
ncbi:hypothetical protein PPACK8108_LOCUS4727 [Phakopsora pachyrhizi]|uniref:Secreted protein n=1 Tax=Phakopsora pachyrhizi TaxID=170000 RepID=A0AAV0AMF4_PHAPC|nr:hypothetical protein PPACK8108_LOCUS4727 [Phakopsora pachyrhizi]